MRPEDEPLTECCPRRQWGDGTCDLGCKGQKPDIDELIAKSSIGAGLRDIEERGIDAHLVDLEEEMHPKKRRKGTSPTARTLAECRKRGWEANVVERFVRFPPPGHHVDFLGIIDLIAVVTDADPATTYTTRRGVGTLGIQACAGTDHWRRRAKIVAEPRARLWVQAGNRLELWSWAKTGDRGKRKKWSLRVETYADMLAASEVGR